MKRFMLPALLVVVAALALVAWKTYPGSPTWPLSGGFHYVANLHPVSFPTNNPFEQEALFSLSDLRDMQGTSFTPGFTKSVQDPNNHTDGINTWAWINQPNQPWLGLAFVTFQGSRMLDCDIHFNSRPDYRWAAATVDPSARLPFWPVDFRGVSRHEAMHAVGLAHEDSVLCCMNSAYQRGSGVPHTVASGMLPHADDKGGIRALYPRVGAVSNVMATSWREPAQPAGGARQLSLTGTYWSGTQISVPCYLENQGTQALTTGLNGISAGVYLSTNTTITTLDARMGQFTFSGAWPAHTSFFYNLAVTIPTSVATGSYYVGVIFDDANIVAEQHENDNACYLGPIQVNRFAVTSVQPVRGTLIGGDTITVSGVGFATGQTQVAFGGTPATAVNVQSSTTITCKTPTNLRWGAVNVSATKGNAIAILPGGYRYVGGDILATGNPRIAVPFVVRFFAAVDSGKSYGAAASLSAVRGFPLGIRTFPLDFDDLLVMTSRNLIPQMFSGFQGALNGQGQSPGSILLPNDARLVGVSFHVAFLTLDPAKPLGIRTVSRPKKLTIQP